MTADRLARTVAGFAWLAPLAASHAQITLSPTNTTIANLAGCTAASKYSVESITVPPTSSGYVVEGDLITVYVQIKNICNGALSIPWRIDRSGATLASGTAQGVAAGAIVNVSASWTAAPGTFDLAGFADPQNSLNDTGTDRALRTPKVITGFLVRPKPDWPSWVTAAKSSLQTGVNAAIAGATINGSLVGAYGKIDRGGMRTADAQISAAVTAAMGTAPSSVRAAVGGEMAHAWYLWAMGYEMTALGQLNWPTAAAWPAYNYPPTPSVPTTAALRNGNSTGESAMDAAALAAAIKGKLPRFEGSYPGADAAVNDLAQWMNTRFHAWKGSATLCSIYGSGIVPGMAGSVFGANGMVSGTVTAKLCGGF